MTTDKNSHQILENFALEIIKEQRRKRRWGIFFKLITFSIILFSIWGLFPWDSMSLPHHNIFKHQDKSKKTQVARIGLFGEINDQKSVTAEDVIAAMDSAAEDRATRAIILDISSPGGSPVQASYVYNEIQRLQKKYPKIEIDSVCEDLCASAAYYIASASKNIYANPTSLVGSIGVLMDEFGFVDTLKKLGATRRLYTAGKYKGMLDPFTPVHPEAMVFVQSMLDSDHDVFIHDVKMGRGARLSNDPNLFTGLIWNGLQAKKLGLIDGFGSVADIARERYDSDEIIDFTVKKSMLEQMFGQFSASFWHQFKTIFLSAHIQ